MKKNVRLMILTIFALFVMPLVFVQGVSAGPLESFAENPIPYWDDDSLDTSVTWDSTAQTVTFEYDEKYDRGYEEDMSGVTDWDSVLGEEDTDGDIGWYDITGDNSYDWFYTDGISLPIGNYNLEFRAKANITGTKGYMNSFTLDGRLGVALLFTGYIYLTTDFVVYEYDITTIAVTESFGWYSQHLDTDHRIFFDYIRIWLGTGDLDVRVPINRQSIQSVEFMGNFSALNSTVRFQMYDNNTASGLWCDVNSTQVTFPDASYAEFTEGARINFSLNEEIRIFKIYVYAQDMTLINYYSSYAGLANKDYLRMTDSAFNGSYQLLYLQGDLGYLAEVIDTDNIFYMLFLSLDMWGYLGPIGLVIAGYFLTKKETILGILWFVVECLFMAQYFALVSATPQYWWHIFILLLGGLFTCVYPLWDR